MDFVDYLLSQYQVFLFVLVRVSAIIFSAPIFGSENIPKRLKVGFAIVMSLILLPLVSRDIQVPQTLTGLFIGMVGEFLIGIALGLTVKFIFVGATLAGQFVGIQMGLGMANVFDPQSQSQISVVAQFINLMAVLLLLQINGHHYFLIALAKSFDILEPYSVYLSRTMFENILHMSSGIFVLAFQIASPVIAVLMFVYVTLGILGRTVPQMNVFVVGFPLTIAVGLLALGLSLPMFILLMRKVMDNLQSDLFVILRSAAGGG
jgi:flagellar biosynthetic protein FliR